MKQIKKTKNAIPRNEAKLQEAGEKALAGATQYGLTIGLLHNTQAAIGKDLGSYVTARGAFELGNVDLAAKRAAVRAVVKTAREFLIFSRHALAKELGRKYSVAWNVTGFVGSFRVPETAATLQVRLQAMQTYLADHPEAQNDGLNVTAARAGELLNDMKTARAAVTTAETDWSNLLSARKAAAKKLGRRVSWLLQELGRLLDPMDPRWPAFGFKKPGAQVTPDAPEDVAVVLIDSTAAAVKWTAAPRAEHYRVWKKIVGVDADFVAVGSPADLDFTLEGLPPNVTVEIAISAVNDGGESALSSAVTLVMK